MWQTYALLAQDMIRDRQREADAAALRHAANGQRRSAARPGLARRAFAAALRRVEIGATAISHRACVAATRLEGRAA